MFDLKEHPHRRWNPLTREWVLVSPHRTKRPWQGQTEDAPPELLPEYDPACYLCPGNERAGGARNPEYSGAFAFTNDFAALLPDTPAGVAEPHPLMRAESVQGVCRVICFSPRHDLTLAMMDKASIRGVVDQWVEENHALAARPEIAYVQIFENRGSMMGCSNPHPHGQIWASSAIPTEVLKEQASQEAYWQKNRRTMLFDYLAAERADGARIVCENEHFTTLVPWWAVWPFEVMTIARRPAANLSDLRPDEKDGLADILHRVGVRYDNLFRISFPYSMGLHQKPAKGGGEGWHLHLHYHPPLLRSATVRKFLVGYEFLAMPQRDITAEAAAERLRGMPEVHYREGAPQ